VGFTWCPLPLWCRQFYFQAGSCTAKVSLHYSVNREMRLPSRGTAMLRGLHSSCQGVPRAGPPLPPLADGAGGRDAASARSPRAPSAPARARPRWPDVAIGSCSCFLQPRASQYLSLLFTVFPGCRCAREPFTQLKSGPGAGAGWRKDPQLTHISCCFPPCHWNSRQTWQWDTVLSQEPVTRLMAMPRVWPR